MGVFFGKKRMTTATAKKTLVILLTVLELTSIPLPVAGEDKPKRPMIYCYQGSCEGCTEDKPTVEELTKAGKLELKECWLGNKDEVFDPADYQEGSKPACARRFYTQTRKYEDTKQTDQVITSIIRGCTNTHSGACRTAGCETKKWPDQTKYGDSDRYFYSSGLGRTLGDNSTLGTDTKPNDAAAAGGDPAKSPDSNPPPPEPAAAGVRRKREAGARKNPDKIDGKKYKSINMKQDYCICDSDKCNGNGGISAGTNLLGSKHLLVTGLLLMLAPSAVRNRGRW